MPSEIGGEHESDRTNRRPESGRSELTPEQRWEWAKSYSERLSESYEQEQEESFAAAETRGLTRDHWLRYRALALSDSVHAGELESARYDLRGDPPDWMGGKHFTPEPQRTEYYAKARERENRALEYFRTEPAEGPENKPIDPERQRPTVRWVEGDPPIDPGDLDRRDAVLYQRPERRDWQNPDTGLRGPNAMSDPRLTPEQHTEKVESHRTKAAVVMGADQWANSHYAGKQFEVREYLRDRFTDGVEFSDEGFPQFDRYGSKTVIFEEGFRGPRRKDDETRANQVFGWERTPRGRTWHHCEDGRTMLLVDRDLHRETRHWGGVRAAKQSGLWEGRDQ